MIELLLLGALLAAPEPPAATEVAAEAAPAVPTIQLTVPGSRLRVAAPATSEAKDPAANRRAPVPMGPDAPLTATRNPDGTLTLRHAAPPAAGTREREKPE